MLKTPILFLKRKKAKRSLTKLTSHHNPKLKAIGIAILETLDNELSDEEEQAISEIEARRTLLLNSTITIPIIDYGAGSHDSQRTQEEMEKGVRSTASVSKITTASKPKFWATMLFKMIRKIKPSSCVELGSCVGISASYQASALKLNGKGKIVTLEGSAEIANIARETFATLGINNASVVTGPFHETLSGVFESAKPVDLFFNDGHHDHDAVMRYFKQVLPYLSDPAVIVFDDISWSPGMRKAWTEIENDEHVSASIDLNNIGIVVIDKDLVNKERLRILL
jgi:predicted O-methyltransferase YrrM